MSTEGRQHNMIKFDFPHKKVERIADKSTIGWASERSVCPQNYYQSHSIISSLDVDLNTDSSGIYYAPSSDTACETSSPPSQV
jgi:hypothetical protein